MSDEEYGEEDYGEDEYEEGEETMQDLRDQLEQQAEQIEMAGSFFKEVNEEKENLEEELEDVREQMRLKEEEYETKDEQLEFAANAVRQLQEDIEQANDDMEIEKQNAQETDFRVRESEEQKKALADENTKLKDNIMELEERRKEEEENFEERRKELEDKVTELEEEATRDAEAAAAEPSEEAKEEAKRAQFQSGGRSGRRSAVQTSDFANEQAVRNLTMELEKIQSQLTASETIREEEAKGRREATANMKRMDVKTKNAVKDKEGAERREQDLIQEKDRLTGLLEKERMQISAQQSSITGYEAEIQKLKDMVAFSSNMAEAAAPSKAAKTKTEEKAEDKKKEGDAMGMMSLMDELKGMDEDAFQAERDNFERLIREEKKKNETSKKELAKVQRQLEHIESNGTAGEQGVRSELAALQETHAADSAKIKKLDDDNQRLQAEVTDAVAHASGMESSNSILQADLTEQQAKVEDVESERTKMADDMKEMRSSLDALRTEALDKDGELMKLKRQNRASETRIEELQESLANGEGGGDIDTVKLQSEIARLKAEGGDDEMKEEIDMYKKTTEGLMEINESNTAQIRQLYSETANVMKLRQADSRENAALRANLNKVESQVLQSQEKESAMKREVDKYRREMKKSRMQVLLAQEQDDEIQSLKRQRAEQQQHVKELDAKIRDGQRGYKQLEQQISQLEGVVLDNRAAAQKQAAELKNVKKEFTVVRAKLSLLQGRMGFEADSDGTEGGKRVSDLQFEHFNMTALGILMIHPLLAAGEHDIVAMYKQAKSDGIKFQNYNTWLKEQFVGARNGSKKKRGGDPTSGEPDDGVSEQPHTLAKEDRQLLEQGNTFDCYLKSGRVGRIKKQTIHMKVVDLDGSATIEWILTSAKVNEEPKKIPLAELDGIADGMEKTRQSMYKGVDKATRRGLCFSLVSKKPSKCLDIQVPVGGTVGLNIQKLWIRCLRHVVKEAQARVTIMENVGDTSGIYEVVSAASVVRHPSLSPILSLSPCTAQPLADLVDFDCCSGPSWRLAPSAWLCSNPGARSACSRCARSPPATYRWKLLTGQSLWDESVQRLRVVG